MSPQHSDNSDQLLQAHLYLAGEMTPAEAARFEDLLSQNPACCEALADVVMLQNLLQDSFDVRTISPRSASPLSPLSLQNAWSQFFPGRLLYSNSATVKKVAATFSAILLLAIALVVLNVEENSHNVAEHVDEPASVAHDEFATAKLWSSMRHQRVLEHASIEANSILEDEEDPLEEDSLEVDRSEPTYDIPDWMFAAVEASNRNSSHEFESDDESIDLEETL